MPVTLTFEGGPRDGETLTFARDDLPVQDAFDGYWIEDMIVNDGMSAVPLNRAVPNHRSPFEDPDL